MANVNGPKSFGPWDGDVASRQLVHAAAEERGGRPHDLARPTLDADLRGACAGRAGRRGEDDLVPIEENARIGAHLPRALAQVDLARVLLARDLGGGRARAHVLRRDASTTLDTLGLRIRVREVGGPPAEQATARGATRPVRR